MLQHIGIGILACAFVGSWTWMLIRARPARAQAKPTRLTCNHDGVNSERLPDFDGNIDCEAQR